MQVSKKATSKQKTNSLFKAMLTLSGLFFLSTNASTVYAQDTITEVIKGGVRQIITVDIIVPNEDHFHIDVDTISDKVYSIEEWINLQPKDAEQRNRNLRQLNEKMKEPDGTL